MSIAVQALDLSKNFMVKGKVVQAVDHINLEAIIGQITMLVGPDGAGKTTFLRMCAGLLKPQSGSLQVLGMDVATNAYALQSMISYMPQKFGLYEDLTVMENLKLYADLFGLVAVEFQTRVKELLAMTDLARFTSRLSGKLSGGMKQKLGLACTLLSKPKLLILDEPCVGVDPLSRADLWQIILRMVKADNLTVLVSTAYIDETAYASKVYVFHEGKILAGCTPEELKAQATGRTYAVLPPAGQLARLTQVKFLEHQLVTDATIFAGHINITLQENVTPDAVQAKRATSLPANAEDGFMAVLRANTPPLQLEPIKVPTASTSSTEQIIEVRDLVKQFGDFTAVNHTSFTVNRGEIFGLLGPNGAGKTTTFRMLCGLLPATSGVLNVAGYNLLTARAQARSRIGYVAQKFSLYQDLSVMANLYFFGGVYGLNRKQLKTQIAKVLAEFELEDFAHMRAGVLPGVYKQRLSMAVGTLHDPDILFLDEPTSGIDPFARRLFWHQITKFAANGTTIIITTHFLEEAEYCNRIMIQDAGTMIALGTPQEVRKQGGEKDDHLLGMDEVFMSIVRKSRGIDHA